MNHRERCFQRPSHLTARLSPRLDGPDCRDLGCEYRCAEVRVAYGDWVQSVAFSPDGKRLVTGSYDRTARIWDVATGKQLVTLAGHTATVQSAAFSPNGTRVLTASDDGTARIWDTETGVELAALVGHGDRLSSAVFSPDGSRVATASIDSTARIWDISHIEQGNAFAIACRRLGNDTALDAARARYELGNLVPVCGDHPSLPVDWRAVE